MKDDGVEKMVNCSYLINGITDLYPEKKIHFKPMLMSLITIIKDKVGAERKAASITLAKLAADPELEPIVRDLHGFDVLMSINANLMKTK